MSYDNERAAIETYFKTEWEALSPTTPIGFDGQKFTPVAPSVRLTIQTGLALQRSFARPGTNKVETVGVVQVQIFVAGGEGSNAWREWADQVEGIFRNKKITTAGAVATNAAGVFIIFGKRGQLPYVSSVRADPPFTVATVNAPFVREEAKA